MGIGGIGSVSSFWQDDQSFWNQQQSWSSQSAASTALINAIGSAETKQGKGLAAIANGAALKRVNSTLVADIQKLLSGASSSGGSTSSSGAAGSAGSPAKGVGTAPLTLSTPLSILNIPAGATFTFSAGGNTTTYASTGTDTVGDLMKAINTQTFGNAAITASLNASGDLVLTGKNATSTITVGGLYAAKLGFGLGHTTLNPVLPTPSPPPPPPAPPSKPASTKQSFVTTATVNSGSALSLLSSSGVAGSLVNLLA